jgi:chemotaxis protein MotB
MADEGKKSTVIIVKKKGGHAGAHGGAWKVAYADFVTAMMAFFLLMWLLNMTSKEMKEGLADYFQNFSIFDQPGRNKVRIESPPKATGEKKGKSKVTQEGVIELDPDSIEGQKNQPFVSYGKLTPKEFVDKLQETIETRLADIKNQIKIEITEDGVRIQLVDREGRDMFQPGSSKPTKDCDRALKIISESFRELPNPIALEGHTDSLGNNDGPNGNWQLSTRRALTARETLEEYGVDADQFVRVTGKADTEPLNPADTEDSQNRRVAITLLFDRPKRPDAPGVEPLNEDEGGQAPEETPAPGSGEHGGGAKPAGGHGGGH